MNYGRLIELLTYDEETGKLYNKIKRCGRALVGQEIGTLNSSGHLNATLDGKRYKVHRLVWLNFENFLEDMGIRPEGKTLDRINPFGNYEPSNCRWATYKEQVHNQRRHHVAPEEVAPSC